MAGSIAADRHCENHQSRLRAVNRNGGFLIIGFDDKTLQPDPANAPKDVQASFRQDIIQALISRYASVPFEIRVRFAERDEQIYPILEIVSGVRVPVAVKQALSDAGDQLLRVGEVHFRSLNANGTPSSAIARPQHWRDILDICFDNREADIGRFFRRHMTGPGAVQWLAALQNEPLPPEDALRKRSASVLEEGVAAFNHAVTERGLDDQERTLVDRLSWEIGLAIDPPKTAALPDRNFYGVFAASNPRYTGWPVWLDARLMTDERSRPVVRDGGWEALIVALSTEIAQRLEFFRLDPKGQFYLRRLLQDDAVPSRILPGERLDPVLVIWRLAEAFAVGIAVAKGLGWSDDATLGFTFRWRKLKGRRLDSWSNPEVYIPGGGPAQQDGVTTFVAFPLATPAATLPALVRAATEELFVSFDGTSLPGPTYEELVRRLLERRH
jgi:hypothetical protein